MCVLESLMHLERKPWQHIAPGNPGTCEALYIAEILGRLPGITAICSKTGRRQFRFAEA
jgi:hypothetical protein